MLTQTLWATTEEVIIRRVDFEGITVYSSSVLGDVVGWKPGEKTSEEALKEGTSRLVAFYRQGGYLFAEASVRLEPFGEGMRAVYTLHEGKRARVKALHIAGESVLSEKEIHRFFRFREGVFFDSDVWEKGVQEILNAYANRGHPLARIITVVEEIHPDESTMTFRLYVEEGPPVRFERIEFEGLTKTHLATAKRLVPVREGELYSQRQIEETRHRLLNSGYFVDLHPSLVQRGSTEEKVTLRVRVREGRTGHIAGVLGYAPPGDAGESPQLTGLLEATEINLLGTGREVGFRWESGETRSTQLRYREPSLWGKPLSVGVQWEAERVTLEGVPSRRENGSVRLDWEATPFWNFGGGGQFVRADERTGSGFFGEVLYDRRDFRRNPSRGGFFRVRADLVRGSLTLTRREIEGETYFRLWKRHVLAVRGGESRVYGKSLPPSARLYLGGTTTLRGYRERSFHGTHRLFGGMEYRILTGPESRLFAFLDVGTVEGFSFRIGYGMGAQLESRGGLLRIDYGLAPGTPPSKGKLHLRLGAAF